MPDILACPDHATILRALSGGDTPQEIERIAAHIEGCAACGASLDSLLQNHETVNALRDGTVVGDDGSEVLRALRVRLAGLVHVARPAEQSDATVGVESNHSATWTAGPEVEAGLPLTFLRPAQQPDEIGRLGAYRVLKVLGAGGMGMVFLAEDTQLGRKVALKTMLPNVAQNSQSRERFLREARAAAAIEHPHIVAIFQVGEDNGVPFLAMPFLKGESLEDRLQRVRKFPVADALRIAEEMAEGLAAAHAGGLIHRDIKPGNVWLETRPRRGAPGGMSVVKLLDFGLARAVADDTRLTQSGAIVGTPAFMAPEQARGMPVDGRADLFSLGCVLYTMLTGERPFRGDTTMSLLTALALDTPKAPDAVDPLCPAEVSRLTMHLLEKEPGNRPASARAVVDALAKIQGTADSTSNPWAGIDTRDRTEEIAKAALPKAAPKAKPRKRRLLPLAAVGLMLALAGVGTFFGGTIVRVATNQGLLIIEADGAYIEVAVKDGTGTIKDRTGKREITVAAGKGEIEVKVKDASGEMSFFTKEYRVSRGGREIINVRLELAKAGKVVPPAEGGRTAALLKLDPAKIPAGERFSWQPKELVAVMGEHRARHWGGVQAVAFSPDGKTIASCGGDRHVRLWDAVTMKAKGEFRQPGDGSNQVPSLRFSPDGKTLSCSGAGLSADLWDVSKARPRKRATIPGSRGAVFSPDGRMVVALYHTNPLAVWDVTTDEPKEIHSIKLPDAVEPWSAAFSKDGKTLAAACTDGVIRFWDIGGTKAKELPPIPKRDASNGPGLLTARLTGAMLALNDNAKDIIVWDVNGAEFKKRKKPIPSLGSFGGFALAADGLTLAQWNHEFVIIHDLNGENVAERTRVKFPVRHLNGFYHTPVEVSPDGKSLVSGHADGAVCLWDVSGERAKELHANPSQTFLSAIRVSKDGKTLAVADPRAIRLWDLGGAEPKAGAVLRQEAVTAMAFSDDAKTLTAVGGRAVVLWDLSKAEPEEKAVLDGGRADAGAIRLFLSPDGKLVGRVTPGEKADRLEVFDVAGDGLKRRAAVFESSTKLNWLAFSPDGKTVAASCGDGKARLWDANASATDKPTEIPCGTGTVRFSDDGKFLLAASFSADPSVWAVSGKEVRRRLAVPNPTAWSISLLLTPDGRTAITASRKVAAIDFWDAIPETEQRRLELDGTKQEPRVSWQLPGVVLDIALTPDGKHLVTANANGTVYVLRVPPSKEEPAPARPPNPKTQVEPRPEVGGDADREAAEWVLSVGGRVRVNDQEGVVSNAADLPREPFRLTSVFLYSNPKVSDAGLAHFEGCKHLTQLDLYITQVGDAGLAHFRGCKNLTYLSLYAVGVGDAGLAHFKDCKNLTHLNLSSTKVSDGGLAYFKDCKNLTVLGLSGTMVGDAGLAHFKDCKNLTHLGLISTQVGDAGLAHVAGCKNLTVLDLHGTKVSDAGLAHFEDCKNLAELKLSRTQVGDAGLAHVAGCKNLTALDVGETKVSDAGLAHFAGCKNLTGLRLGGTQVSDAGLAHFAGCKNLTHLDLRYTQVSNAGLAHFKGCSLRELDLTVTKVTDAGLAHFAGCKNLIRLHLSGIRVSDAGLAHFKDCKGLILLDLSGTQATDAVLPHFKDCKGLGQLLLGGTKVSDAGLEVLAGLPSLGSLQVHDTRISKRGYDLLKATMPKCNIEWYEANRTAAEQVLALGGSVTIATPGKDDTRPVKAGALPPEFFQVRRVSLAGVKKPLGELLGTLSRLWFAEFDRLESIDLFGTTPVDLAPLMTVAGLRELSLVDAGLTDESLAQFPKLPVLRRLVLDGNAIRGPGLARLPELPELQELSLGCPALTDLFAKNLADLKKLKKLTKLSLAGATLTDAGVEHLKALTGLTALDLRKTKVTAKGIEELKKALPKCEIEWDGAAAPKGK